MLTYVHYNDDETSIRYLTIQGMSHRAGAHMDTWHAQNPTKPLVSSEAVICPSERGVDSDVCENPSFPPTPGQKCWYNNEVYFIFIFVLFVLFGVLEKLECTAEWCFSHTAVVRPI